MGLRQHTARADCGKAGVLVTQYDLAQFQTPVCVLTAKLGSAQPADGAPAEQPWCMSPVPHAASGLYALGEGSL